MLKNELRQKVVDWLKLVSPDLVSSEPQILYPATEQRDEVRIQFNTSRLWSGNKHGQQMKGINLWFRVQKRVYIGCLHLKVTQDGEYTVDCTGRHPILTKEELIKPFQDALIKMQNVDPLTGHMERVRRLVIDAMIADLERLVPGPVETVTTDSGQVSRITFTHPGRPNFQMGLQVDEWGYYAVAPDVLIRPAMADLLEENLKNLPRFEGKK